MRVFVVKYLYETIVRYAHFRDRKISARKKRKGKREEDLSGLPGSLASLSLVAHIISQKYSNGMPLYRLEKGFLSDGVVISRQNMANWAIKSVEWYLHLIYSMLVSFFMKGSVAHSDGTHTQVLREPGRAPQTKSCVRVYRTSGCCERKIVIYEYTETKDSDAERGVAYITQLFLFEREFKNLSPEERYRMRLEKSKPVSNAFFARTEKLAPLSKSPLGKPVYYALSQREAICNGKKSMVILNITGGRTHKFPTLLDY